MFDIGTAPKDGAWVWLYGEHHGEPRGVLAFWGEGDDWYDGEAASNSVTDFWKPTHWSPFAPPEEKRNG